MILYFLAEILIMINQCNKLQRLEVDNNIYCEDARVVTTLKENRSITYLNLSYNPLYIDGLTNLSAILRLNTNIKQLRLSGFSFYNINTGFLESLITITSLQRLSFSKKALNQDEFTMFARFLANNVYLTRLTFNDSAQSFEPLQPGLHEALSNNNSLIQLNISRIWHNNDQLKLLSRWLQGNTSLTHLTMRNSSLSSDSIDSLCQALEANNRLTYLDLGNNLIGSLGAEKLAIALRKNHVLIQFKLAQNFVGSRGIYFLVSALCEYPNISRFNVRDNAFDLDGILNVIPLLLKKPNLILTLVGKHLQGKEGINYIEMLKNYDTSLNDILYIAKTSTPLVRGSVPYFRKQITPGLSEALNTNQYLRRLTIDGVEPNTNKCLSLINSLQHHRNLQKLELIYCINDGECLITLLEWLKSSNVKVLNLSNNNGITKIPNFFADLLQENRSLIELHASNSLRDNNPNQLNNIFSALLINSTLQKLNISNHCYPGEPFKFLGETLVINQRLTHLNITRCYQYSSEGFYPFLPDKLAKSKSLIYIRYNKYNEPMAATILKDNIQNKENAIRLLKAFACKETQSNNTTNTNATAFIINLPKPVFYIILSYVYPGLTNTIMQEKYNAFQFALKENNDEKCKKTNYNGSEYSLTFFKKAVVDENVNNSDNLYYLEQPTL